MLTECNNLSETDKTESESQGSRGSCEQATGERIIEVLIGGYC